MPFTMLQLYLQDHDLDTPYKFRLTLSFFLVGHPSANQIGGSVHSQPPTQPNHNNTVSLLMLSAILVASSNGALCKRCIKIKDAVTLQPV